MSCAPELVAYLDAAAAGDPASPSPAVDELWHAALTDADGYTAFCRARYGLVVAHVGRGDGACKPVTGPWRPADPDADGYTAFCRSRYGLVVTHVARGGAAACVPRLP